MDPALTGAWFGEGEIKFFMDGDDEFPTICGTGTEDYFCGSHGFPGVFTTANVGTTSTTAAPTTKANGACTAGASWIPFVSPAICA